MNEQKKEVGPPTRGSASRLQTLVCFLLVALLLYNPFIALIHSQAGLTVHHPPRNRSTVGSSELQHFTPVGKNLKAATTPVAYLGEIVVRLVKMKFPLPSDTLVFPVALQEFSSSLWFRPPPSA